MSITRLNSACQLVAREGRLYVVVYVAADGSAHSYMQPYPHEAESPLRVIRTGTPAFTTTDEVANPTRLLFMPVVQPDGETQVVGVTQAMGDVESMLRAKALEIFGFAMLCPLLVVPVVYVANRNMRQTMHAVCTLNMDLTRMNERYKELSYSDTLTGLPNRRAFNENGQRAVSHCQRVGRPLHVLALDLDHFKLVNDTYGHSVGDSVLLGFAQILRDCLRAGDVVGRSGGEEFGVLLPETERQSAVEVAERLRVVCAKHNFMRADGVPFHVTVSVGVAELRLDGGKHDAPITTPDDMLNRVMRQADAALYLAKQQGRNRVCVYGTEVSTGPNATPGGAFSI